MKYKLSFLMLMVTLTGIHQSRSQAWDFAREKDGIKMFTRQEEGSSFKCFRGETVFQAGMEELGQYIGVANNFDQWDENIRELTVLESIPGRHVKCYFVYQTPWPLNNRDFYAVVDVGFDSTGRVKTVNAYPMEAEMPEKDGIIRIRSFWLKWTLTLTDHQTVEGILEGFIDPGGLVPAWLYNLVIVEAPYKVMKGIKKRVETTDGG